MNPALFLAIPALAAVSVPQPAPAPVAQHEPQQVSPEELGFTDDGTRMKVPVTIGPHGPFGFIVDTGAERTVISRELAGTLGLSAGRTVRITAMAGPARVATFLIPQISVGSIGGDVGRADQRVTGTAIEAPALVQRNLGADGLVGIDTLQGHAVTIDFPRQSMTITPASKRLRVEHFGANDIVIRARNMFGQLVVTDATYRGYRVRVVIDTGSVVSMGNLALRRLASSEAMTLQPVKLLSVTGGVLDAEYTQIGRIRIGDVGFSNLPIAFSDAPPFARFGLDKRPALLLGMDALRLFGQVRIDFANREVRLARPKDLPTF